MLFLFRYSRIDETSSGRFDRHAVPLSESAESPILARPARGRLIQVNLPLDDRLVRITLSDLDQYACCAYPSV